MFTDTYTVIWILEQNQMLRGVQITYRFFMLPLDFESLQKEIIRMKTSTRTQWSPFLLNMNGPADEHAGYMMLRKINTTPIQSSMKEKKHRANN